MFCPTVSSKWNGCHCDRGMHCLGSMYIRKYVCKVGVANHNVTDNLSHVSYNHVTC